jgi:hypothetical protein
VGRLAPGCEVRLRRPVRKPGAELVGAERVDCRGDVDGWIAKQEAGVRVLVFRGTRTAPIFAAAK